MKILNEVPNFVSRSPHGERGLKLDDKGGWTRCEPVALLTESVD